MAGSVPLYCDNITGLQAFITLIDIKFNRLTIAQRAMAFAPDRTKMDKHVFAIVPCDKTKPFTGIEPFDATLLPDAGSDLAAWLFLPGRFVCLTASDRRIGAKQAGNEDNSRRQDQ